MTAWSSWFILTRDVTLEKSAEPIGAGSVLHLKIFGSPITTRIDEFMPDSRLSWIPQSTDETKASHYHAWRLTPDPGGCHVVTGETGIDPADVKAPEAVGKLMHGAHDLWLASLRWKAEQ